MFVVELCTILTIILTIYPPLFSGQEPTWYYLTITLILVFTLLFANYAESLAELQGEAHADSLKALQVESEGKRLKNKDIELDEITEADYEVVAGEEIEKGDYVFAEKGDIIPRDGEVVEGSASIDESAITGESEPVIRESGGDRNSVTEGTEVLSDVLKIEVTAAVGESFLDRMIDLVETASRQKTPNEISMTLILASFTFVYLTAVVTMRFFGMYVDMNVDVANLIALLIGLMPTTIGALLASIRIAGMTRVTRENIIAKSGKAVESAGDLDALILDKTGTITTGERIAEEFIVVGSEKNELYKACLQSSYFDETPEGRSVVNLAHDLDVEVDESELKKEKFVEFSAKTRMSGIDLPDGTEIRKGSVEAVKEYAEEIPDGLTDKAHEIADSGGTPLAVAVDKRILGLIELQDELKIGIKARIQELQEMGVKCIMATGDNERTARYVAEQAGIEEYYSEFKPEEKIALVEKIQKSGKLIGMTGDGTNDAPALAKADVGLAMQAGTNAAKEAGNMVDLDSDPTKLIEVVAIGKQLLMTRGSLTTFSIANDISRYFALIPAIFSAGIPALQQINFMNLYSPQSVVIASLIYNSLIIPFLIPLAMKGVDYKAESSSKLLRKNLVIYGGAGLIAPFISIKLIDMLLVMLGVF
ncbi:K+-transporting ATPase ATPase B chain [Halanaerobium sp. DL-01]|uniref:potassium-transporting ATPase subunit KdpB n=1 Tax=Halanaerobium sp. DL-01 TaxID=1653064 RepID=UPI000DF23B1E|nr:K+-transporting ATPase ATPase B chain [Halanaerobium sp. DL-01]